MEAAMRKHRLMTLIAGIVIASVLISMALSPGPIAKRKSGFVASAADEVTGAGDASHRAQIMEVLNKQVEAWNQRDLEGFMRGYWRSTDLTFYSGGTPLSGWQSTLDRYRQRYQSEGREMGHLDFSDLQIEGLGSDAAFVRGKWHLKMTAGEAGGLFTLIFRRFSDGWKIVHDHTSSSS
jgi:ketosteroid isomerase-like protein